jgi:hypothetical protein
VKPGQDGGRLWMKCGHLVNGHISRYRPEPDFTRRWLRDPQALHPDARIPDLDLSDAEIEAFIAFLTEGTGD